MIPLLGSSSQTVSRHPSNVPQRPSLGRVQPRSGAYSSRRRSIGGTSQGARSRSTQHAHAGIVTNRPRPRSGRACSACHFPSRLAPLAAHERVRLAPARVRRPRPGPPAHRRASAAPAAEPAAPAPLSARRGAGTTRQQLLQLEAPPAGCGRQQRAGVVVGQVRRQHQDGRQVQAALGYRRKDGREAPGHVRHLDAPVRRGFREPQFVHAVRCVRVARPVHMAAG
jgi:hypothetical protein